MTFEEAWEVTSKIGGYFEKEEAELYWRMLERLPPNAIVVEVGVENGRSTSIPMQFDGVAIVHAVDNFITYGDEGFKRFCDTMISLGSPAHPWTLWRRDSVDMVPVDIMADLILIDADHDDIETDCAVWINKLKLGGIMLFHDYGNPSWNIKATVDRYCEGWQGETVCSLAARINP